MKNRRISLESLVYAVDLETAEMGWYTLRQKDTVNTILRLPPEGVIQALNDQIVDQHPWGQQIFFKQFAAAKRQREQIQKGQYRVENRKSVS